MTEPFEDFLCFFIFEAVIIAPIPFISVNFLTDDIYLFPVELLFTVLQIDLYGKFPKKCIRQVVKRSDDAVLEDK